VGDLSSRLSPVSVEEMIRIPQVFSCEVRLAFHVRIGRVMACYEALLVFEVFSQAVILSLVCPRLVSQLMVVDVVLTWGVL
jgi:hypothetical protein